MPLVFENYEEIETIGSGSFGCCKKVRRKSDNKIFAWKEIDYGLMREDERKLLITEVNTLRHLSHPNILSYKGYILNKVSKTLYIVTEYCLGGDLQMLIRKHKRTGTFLEEKFIWKVLCQVLLALRECHDHSMRGEIILHRDIKPANIFLTQTLDVKVGDFGMARMLPSTSAYARTVVGTPYYMSPEIMNNISYNHKSDIWALGCLIYELAAFSPPFCGGSWSVLAKQKLEGKWETIPDRFSKELDMIIRKMLTVKVKKRPSAEELLNNSVVAASCTQLGLQRDGAIKAQSHEKNARDAAIQEDKENGVMELYRDPNLKPAKMVRMTDVEARLAQGHKVLSEQEKALNKKAKELENHGGPTKYKCSDSIASSSQSSSNGSRNARKHTALTASSHSSSNSVANAYKHVRFEDTGPVEDKPRVNYQPGIGRAKSSLHFANKENLPCDGLRDSKFHELKSSLKMANRRALQLRMAEIESQMRLSPFI